MDAMVRKRAFGAHQYLTCCVLAEHNRGQSIFTIDSTLLGFALRIKMFLMPVHGRTEDDITSPTSLFRRTYCKGLRPLPEDTDGIVGRSAMCWMPTEKVVS